MAHWIRGSHLLLQGRYGWDRTLFDTLAGAQTWCGLGVLADNTVKIAHLVQAGPPGPPPSPARSTSPPIGAGPCRDRAPARSLFHRAAA